MLGGHVSLTKERTESVKFLTVLLCVLRDETQACNRINFGGLVHEVLDILIFDHQQGKSLVVLWGPNRMPGPDNGVA
jgi:hypothetical protein